MSHYVRENVDHFLNLNSNPRRLEKQHNLLFDHFIPRNYKTSNINFQIINNLIIRYLFSPQQ